jgi:hypothetical protein
MHAHAGDHGERDTAVRQQEHHHGERAVPRAQDRGEGRRPARHPRHQPSPAQHLAALVIKLVVVIVLVPAGVHGSQKCARARRRWCTMHHPLLAPQRR